MTDDDEYDEAAAAVRQGFDLFFTAALGDCIDGVALAGPELLADFRSTILTMAGEAFDDVVELRRIVNGDRSG